MWAVWDKLKGVDRYSVLVAKFGPLLVGLLYVGGRLLLKFVGGGLAPTQIEFTVDDLPGLRVYTDNLAGCYAPRSEAPVLGGIALRIGGK